MAKEITEEVKPIFASLGSAAEVPGKGIAGLLDMLRTVLESKPVKDVTEGIPPNVMPAGAMAKGGAAGAGWLGKLLAASPGVAAGYFRVGHPELAGALSKAKELLPRRLWDYVAKHPDPTDVVFSSPTSRHLGRYMPADFPQNSKKIARIEIPINQTEDVPTTLAHEVVHDAITKRFGKWNTTIPGVELTPDYDATLRFGGHTSGGGEALPTMMSSPEDVNVTTAKLLKSLEHFWPRNIIQRIME